MDEETSASNCSSHTQPPHLAKSRTRAPHYSDDHSRLHTITIGVSDSDSNETTMSSLCSDHTSSGNGKEQRHRHVKEHNVHSSNSDNNYIPETKHGRRSRISRHHSRNSEMKGGDVHSNHVDHETSTSSSRRKVKRTIRVRRGRKQEEQEHQRKGEEENKLSKQQSTKTNLIYDDNNNEDRHRSHWLLGSETKLKRPFEEEQEQEWQEKELVNLPRSKTSWSYGNEWTAQRKTAQRVTPLLHVTVQQSSSDNDRTNGSFDTNNNYNNNDNKFEFHSNTLSNNELTRVPFQASSISTHTSLTSTPFRDFVTSNVSTPQAKWRGRHYKEPHHPHHYHFQENNPEHYEPRKHKEEMKIIANHNKEKEYESVNGYNVINSPNMNDRPTTLITIPGIRTSKSSTPERLCAQSSTPKVESHTWANKDNDYYNSDELLNLFDNVQTRNLSAEELQSEQNTLHNFPINSIKTCYNSVSNEADDLSSAVRVVEVQLQQRLQQLRVLQKMYNKLNSHNSSLAREFNTLRANYTKMQSQLTFHVSNEVRHVKADLNSLKKFTQLVLDDFSECMCSTTNEIMDILLLLSKRSEPEQHWQQSIQEGKNVNFNPAVLPSESSMSTKGLLASKTHMIVDHFHQQLQQSQKEQQQEHQLEEHEHKFANNNNKLMHKPESNYVNQALLVPETSYDWYNGISPQRLPSHEMHSSKRKAINEKRYEQENNEENDSNDSLLHLQRTPVQQERHRQEHNNISTPTPTMATSPKSLTTSHNSIKNATSRRIRRSKTKNNHANMRSVNDGNVKKHENDVVSSRSNKSSSSTIDSNEYNEESEIFIDVLEGKLQCATEENWRLRSELERNQRQWQERINHVKDAHKAREMTLSHELELMRSALAKHYYQEQHNNSVDTKNNNNNIRSNENITTSNKEEKQESFPVNIHDKLNSVTESKTNKCVESTPTTMEDNNYGIKLQEEKSNEEKENKTQEESKKYNGICVECDDETPTSTNFTQGSFPVNSSKNYSSYPNYHNSISNRNCVNTRSNVPEVERRVKALVARSLHHTHDIAAKRNSQIDNFNDSLNSISNKTKHLLNNLEENEEQESQSYSTQMHDELIKRAQHYLQVASDQKKSNAKYESQEEKRIKDITDDKCDSKIIGATLEPTSLHHQTSVYSPHKLKNASCRTPEQLSKCKNTLSADKRKRSPKNKSKMAILADGLWAEKLLAQRQRETKRKR